MHPTRHHLPVCARVRLGRMRSQRLADAPDPEAATERVHWIVKGPIFNARRELSGPWHRAGGPRLRRP